MYIKIQMLVVLISVISLWGQVPSNLDILQGMVSQPVMQALDSLAPVPLKIKIESKTNSDFCRWIVQQLQKDLLAKNFWLFTNSDSSQADLTLVIEDLQSSIVYRVIDRNLFFRSSRYERTIELLLAFHYKNNQESILYTFSKRKEQKDVVRKSEIAQLENKFYSFSQGQKIESSLMSKLIEPAIVTVATAGVVYLFFSLRSGS
jgi:hypothetical protein